MMLMNDLAILKGSSCQESCKVVLCLDQAWIQLNTN